jgi:hypothetical protein
LSKPDPTIEQQLAMLVYNSMRTEKYYAYWGVRVCLVRRSDYARLLVGAWLVLICLIIVVYTASATARSLVFVSTYLPVSPLALADREWSHNKLFQESNVPCVNSSSKILDAFVIYEMYQGSGFPPQDELCRLFRWLIYVATMSDLSLYFRFILHLNFEYFWYMQ